MKIAIVTDSTSDIPHDLVEKHQIEVIPAIVVIGAKQYADGEGLSRREFYEQLPFMKTPPTTASPSVGTFEEVYDRLLGKYDQVVSIHVASTLSGIVNAATIAAKQFHDKVVIVDSRQLSMGLGFQVLAAAKAAAEFRLIDAVLQQAAAVRNRLRVVAMLDTLEYLRRSGRVTFLRASLGSMLRMRLFVEIIDGQVSRLEQSRTRQKSVVRLGEILRNAAPSADLAVLHTNAEDDAREFIRQALPEWVERTRVINVTTVIGTHVGPKGIGFAAVT